MKSLKEFIKEERVDPKFQKLVDDVAKMTDRNDHNGARLAIAKAIKHKKGMVVMKAMQDIQKIERSLPSDLIKYREFVRDEMLKFVEQKMGKEARDMLYGAL